MRLGAYSVRDEAVGAFMRPFYAVARAEAVRTFSDAVKHPDSDMGRHAADFSLFHVGTFDDHTGTFASLQVPERIVAASECLGQV